MIGTATSLTKRAGGPIVFDMLSKKKATFLTPCQILFWPRPEAAFGARAAEKPMRPREFDHDDVLRVAFEQFWRKGVRGTSLSDIARDAGVQRGSLYNAFGSKEALFLSAYQRYSGEYLGSVQKALGAGSLRKRLTAFFDLTIKNFRAGSPPRGCPTTRGLMELGSAEGEGLDEDARKAFADLVTRVTALIEQAFVDGRKQGEF